MKIQFADSFYFFALTNSRDPYHGSAQRHRASFNGRIVVTGWIATELADGFVQPQDRGMVAKLIDQFRTDPGFVYIPCTDELMSTGLDMFRARPDKSWSLTDCISFVVMGQHKLTEALTADHHFEQAGFVALLKLPKAS